ncbi:MAG: alpha/beta fold hydrolase [Xanthomonadales bacterium]
MSLRLARPLALLALLAGAASSMAAEVGWQRPFSDVAALSVRAPDRVIAYGPAASQFGELWLPPGREGAAPVVVLVHGGCWLAEYGIAHIRPLAASLAQAGFAIWALEYRRVGEAGGGWPGTFRDVAAGIDHLAQLDEPRLDVSRVVLAGHSAGGHLALWAASRDRLSPDSTLHMEPEIRPNGVLGLAAITDLVAYASDDNSCARVTPRLLGGTPFERPERYEQASPAALGSRTNTILLQGEADAIVPPAQAEALPGARVVLLPEAGHFDLIHPDTPAFERIRDLLEASLNDAP